MSRVEEFFGRMVTANNDSMRKRALDANDPNPRIIGLSHWAAKVTAAYPEIRTEWDTRCSEGLELPHISDLIREDQGNEGGWRAGLLMSRGQPIKPLASLFPTAISMVKEIPGIWSVLWSVFEPGTELPTHVGPNAGMLRFHLGVDCGNDSGLKLGERMFPYRNGEAILFDDTVEHSAWNRGSRRRVTLFCEVLRPSKGLVKFANLTTQVLLATDHRYREAPKRAAQWHEALNGK